MKILYVGTLLPLAVSKELRTSIAAQKFEQSLVRALDEELKGNVDVVTFADAGHSEIKRDGITEIYLGKPFIHVPRTKIPILRDVVKNAMFFVLALRWCWRNIGQKRVILVMNSPCGICASLISSRLFGTKIVSITIDTPYTPSNSFEGVYGRYVKACFWLGHRMLGLFSGIVVLNKAAVAKLGLKIPHLVVPIGYDEETYPHDHREHAPALRSDPPFNIVYAGTLIDYNGVVTLARAFALMDPTKYVLHIYGSGPLEGEIARYSQTNSNIVFHGLVNNADLLKELAQADLLVNPRVTSASVVDFTFPSKLIEYILSGRPVLTTNFSSLPREYSRFAFLIEDESPAGYCAAIEHACSEDVSQRTARCNDGMRYVRRHQGWKTIAKDVHSFVESL